jgi:hypothetical protein
MRRPHFVRYDVATAKKDSDISPAPWGVWEGETIKLVELHAFCATRLREPTYPLYCVSRTNKTKIGVIVSYDQGATWHDYAEGNVSGDTNPWSVAGAREITDDGYLIGTYTNHVSWTPDNQGAVRFFKVKVQDPSTTPTKTPTPAGKRGDFNKDGKVDIFDYNLLIANFGKTNALYNLTGSNLIDIFDYNIFVSVWGK